MYIYFLSHLKFSELQVVFFSSNWAFWNYRLWSMNHMVLSHFLWQQVLQNLKIVYNIVNAIVSLETAKCPILHIYLWPWNHYPAILTIILIFAIFYHKFSFRDTLLSIFGNVNWTLKIVPPNIILIFFYDFFPYCIAIFHLTWSHLPYLEMSSGSWKQ